MNRTETIQKAKMNLETLQNTGRSISHPNLPSDLVYGFYDLPETIEAGLNDLAWVLGHNDYIHCNDAIGFFEMFLEKVSPVTEDSTDRRNRWEQKQQDNFFDNSARE